MSRKEEIIQAALELVNESGVDAMSVRNVAARAGIGASTLRYYFPTHRDLVNAVANAVTVDTLGDLRIHDASVSARERLAECLCQFLPQSEAQMPVLEGLVTVYATCFKDGRVIGSPHLAGVGIATREKVAGWLTVLAKEGRSLPMPEGDLARLLISHINGVALDLIAEGPEFTLKDAFAEVAKMAALVLPED